MKLNHIILPLICLFYSLQIGAQYATLSPVPQSVKWGEKLSVPQCINIKGADMADKDAIDLLKTHFGTTNKGVKLIIGQRGDKTVEKYWSAIPNIKEGYYLKIDQKKIVVAGNDETGTYYGVQTLLSIVSSGDYRKATIQDFPDVGERGVVEGFYGNPWSHKDRLRQFDFYGKNKLNVYIYGPKDDHYHRKYWREPYPADMAAKLKELVEAAHHNKVNFVWAMHPGNDIEWNEADRETSLKKLNLMYELGIRSFAIFFDDIAGKEQARADKQAEYLNYLQKEFVDKHNDISPLIMCPNEYNKGWTGKEYLPMLGKELDSRVRIMWTGNTVVDMINEEDMDWINQRIKRNAYIWLNYPVNDYCISHLLMGATYGNDKTIANKVSGFVSNPMEYAEASKVSLYSIADYTWNMQEYDEEKSWYNALDYVMKNHRDAFQVFCNHNVDLGASVHGLRRAGESADFQKLVDNYSEHLLDAYNSEAAKAFCAEYAKMVSAADELMADKSEPELLQEIAPWVRVMKYVGLRGQKLMQMYESYFKGDAHAFVTQYKELVTLEKEQFSIISRNFKGSIKKPNPTVATSVVMPFFVQTLNSMIEMYKGKYTYMVDVFPEQIIESGRYYIKCNGRWLTNARPNPDGEGDSPVWKDNEDVVNPQRQEWIVTLDYDTERYKIVNAQDGRYINEHGSFWEDKENNPYNASWHSYILHRKDGKYAIQTSNLAKHQFWTVIKDRVVRGDEKTLHDKFFIFEFIPVK